MPTSPRILVSGAGIAGPTLAWWLARHGVTPTVVELAPAPRPGGNGVDLRGAAVRIADAMGVLPAVRELATDIRQLTFVDADGRRVAGMPTSTFNGPDDLEVMRGDLARVLYEATADDADYRFGDAVASITQDEASVQVEFTNGTSAKFDLVIGADGLHSRVRELAVRPESEAAYPLGLCFATAAVDPDFGTAREVTLHNAPGRVAGVYRSGRHASAQAFFAFRAPRELAVPRDQQAQKELLRSHFDTDAWRVGALVDAATADPGFYLDAITQIRMPGWSRGRVGLVGDAGYCATLLSGAGASLAVEGAHRLATELAVGDGHRAAFARYERGLRATVRARQRSVGASRAMLIPGSRTGVRLRDQFTRLMVLPPLAARVFRPERARAA
ncbi:MULTISPECIES: FAD-dependent monooxygenase [unclassified Nocardia]|uniref:FAD-dependent monooxygenase n=1 Tax=unclassified Nocardia TaxID=2637762 RepID=UPI0033A23504